MGNCSGKAKRPESYEDSRVLRRRIKVLEEEMREVGCKREQESRAYMQQSSIFSAKESEWKREKNKTKDEVGRLKKKLEGKEEKIRSLEEKMMTGNGEKDWELRNASFLVEQMREEQTRREEAVEKWKQLYFAIKIELDDLIHRTQTGEKVCWLGDKDDEVECLQKDLKVKEEMIQTMKAQILDIEKEGVKKEREIDILRQSLRIISNAKRAHAINNVFHQII